GRSLVAGDAAGRVLRYVETPAPESPSRRTYALAGSFQPHAAAVTGFDVTRRDKRFLTVDSKGGLRVHHGTSGRTLIAFECGGSGRAAAMAPRGDGVWTLDESGRVQAWSIRNPHPEITGAVLFSRIHYEGYASPEFVWQTTGGSDGFEAKFSFTPLVYGTLKGTF